MEDIRKELNYIGAQKYKINKTPIKNPSNRSVISEINTNRYLASINKACNNMMRGHMYLTQQMDDLKNNVSVDLGKIKKKVGISDEKQGD